MSAHETGQGANGYVGSAQVHLCKLHDQTFCKGYTPKYIWGSEQPQWKGMQQEPLTLKDLTEMKRAMAWGRHVKQLIVFRWDDESTGMAFTCKWVMHCPPFWPCSCPGYVAPCFYGLQPGGHWDCLLSSGDPSQLCKLTAAGLSFLENEEPAPIPLPLGCTASAEPASGRLSAPWGAGADAIYTDHMPKLSPPAYSSRG